MDNPELELYSIAQFIIYKVTGNWYYRGLFITHHLAIPEHEAGLDAAGGELVHVVLKTKKRGRRSLEGRDFPLLSHVVTYGKFDSVRVLMKSCLWLPMFCRRFAVPWARSIGLQRQIAFPARHWSSSSCKVNNAFVIRFLCNERGWGNGY